MARQNQKKLGGDKPVAAAADQPDRPDGQPGSDCPRCPRLVAFRHTWRERETEWFNAPVPSFGSREARLLVVGLAPGLRGANRTGRPFTGDYAGDLLYQTLLAFGFAKGIYQAKPDDGLSLIDCRISNAVRCVPPENKPTPLEIASCRPFLIDTIAEMKRLSVVLALGRVAHDTTVAALGNRPARVPFGHGTARPLGHITLFDSYHCSRYNTNTGVLTEAMFRKVIGGIRAQLDAAH